MKTRKTRIKFKRKRKVFAKLNRMATHNHSTTEPNPYIGNPAPPPSPSPSPQDSQLYQRPNSYLPPSADVPALQPIRILFASQCESMLPLILDSASIGQEQ